MARPTASVLDLVAKARWAATKLFPYLSRALYAAAFIECDAVPTMAVDDRWRVYVNPAHIRECMAESFDAVIVGVIHEILHPTLHHQQRGKTMRVDDPAHWNTCGDCELVQSILAVRRNDGSKLQLWTKDVTPARMEWPDGLSAEEYYRLPRSGKDGKRETGAGAPCSGGSGAGRPGPWELPEGAAGPAGVSPAEAAVIRAVVAQATREHAANNGAGNVPGGLLRWAETMLAPPVIDWQSLIAARVRYHLDTHLGPVASYARPSRRRAGGLVLPVHRTPRASVIIVGDTSGSMGASDISKVIGVVHDAVSVLGTVKALGCDAEAAEPVEINHIDDLREALRGGGGTEMTAGIERAAESEPDAIVVVTDGYTSWPADPPACPVIIVLTQADTRAAVPAWADVIDASSITDESKAA